MMRKRWSRSDLTVVEGVRENSLINIDFRDELMNHLSEEH